MWFTIRKAWSEEAREASLAARHSSYGQFHSHGQSNESYSAYRANDRQGTTVEHWRSSDGKHDRVSEWQKDYPMTSRFYPVDNVTREEAQQFLQHRYGVEAV